MGSLIALILIGGGVLIMVWILLANRREKSAKPRSSTARLPLPNKPGLQSTLQSNSRFTLLPSSFDPDGSGPLDGRGYIAFHQHKQKAIPWEALNYLDGLEACKVAGTSHRLPALQSEAFSPGRLLALVREPSNPHDRNAVGVWDLQRIQQIGYLPREIAEEYAPRLDGDEHIRCLSMWEHLKDGQRVGLRVLLILENASIQLPPA